MKARRLVVLALALVTVVTMGIGYAALSETLSVTATATLTASGAQEVFDGEVYFSGATVPAAHTNVVAGLGESQANPADPSAKPDVAWISINDGMSVANDTIEVTFTIQNDSAGSVDVTIVGGTSADGNFKTNGSMTTNSIPANSSGEVTVVVTLLNTVSSDITGSTVPITFTVKSAS